MHFISRILTAAGLAVFGLVSGVVPAFAAGSVFEVASVTPCDPGTAEPPMEHAGIADFISPGGRFTARATTLKFLIEWAYGIQTAQHSDGPAWVSEDRYDVVAKAAGNTTDDEVKAMVRELLTQRFGLKLRQDRREMSALVMSLGKMPAAVTSPKEGEVHGMGFRQVTIPNESRPAFRIAATRYTLKQLADTFSRQLKTVIVNETGLDGEYDFTLDLIPDETRPSPMDPGLLIAALREQLHLNVKQQKTAVDYYVIDGVEKVVAGN